MGEIIEELYKKSDECMRIAQLQNDLRLVKFWTSASIGYLIKIKNIVAQNVQGEN